MTAAVVVIGPSGCGKSTLAALLATALDRPFVEGDALHPPANLAKMVRGEPLDDSDRAPFLDAVAATLAGGQAPVVSCSALKRIYRDRLRNAAPGVVFVHPLVPRDDLIKRVDRREGHFMPASQIDDQLATLEPLEPDETGFTVDGVLAPDEQLRVALQALTLASG